MASYDWSRFTVHMHYRAAPEAVFAAWATPSGLESFFIGSAHHVDPHGVARGAEEIAVAGDGYAWVWLHGFALEGHVVDCVPGRSVTYTFGGGMQFGVTVVPMDDVVEVRLDQWGCATEDPERAWQHLNCRSCWVYFLTNLKSILEHGTDLRDRVHPDRNDSVSIGWPGGA